MKPLFIRVSFFMFVLNGFCSNGQSPLLLKDTVSITVADAEKLFLQNNFQLLASKFQVNAADAAIVQTKLWDNPVLSIDQGAYNKANKKWFDVSKNGETAVSLQQLILLGGKRKDQINIAKINSHVAQFQFYDLLRNLRYQLHSSFYGLYFLRQSISVYDKEIESLKTLITVYNDQYQKGNVAFKELARLEALQFSLENERVDLLKDAAEKQNDLILLTSDTLLRPIKPTADFSFANSFTASNITYGQLIDSALANRYDLQIANSQVQLYQSNLALQKAQRVPDITLGANYDRAGSYIYDYNSLSLSFPIPLLNRNQGNIRIAKFQIEESKQQLSLAELQVKTDVNKAYSQFIETNNLYQSATSQFNPDYEKLLDGITKGYQNRTISLLEFIDYYETYKNSKIEFNKLQNNRLDALENLNLATGTTLIK